VSLDRLHPAVSRWFSRQFGAPSAPQRDGWPAILAGEHTLIAAPTGSGKTLAAFLCAIDSLVREGLQAPLPDETRVLYVSPLKALGNDIEKNLKWPLAGIEDELHSLSLPSVNIRTLVRSGDTPARAREGLRKRPPHILVTTPESLCTLLTSEGGRNALRNVRAVIVDEIHALVGDRRGAHLSLSLERLCALTGKPVQRIGLSATQRPIDVVARFLVGGEQTPCRIVDHGHRRDLRVSLEVPSSPLEAVMAHEVWDELYERLVALIATRRTTLVFVNTRRLAERVCKELGDRLGAQLVAAHHGSLSRERRLQAETRLKNGELKALVATASLELGIDIGSVDLVCQIGSTRSIASFLQRIGRSGHRADAVSEGRLFPLSRDELCECVALVQAVARGELDQTCVAPPSLDVLAQQLVAAVAAEGEWEDQALFELVRRAYPYRALPRADFDAVLRMIVDGFATARGRRGALLHHDRVNHRVRPRKGARLTAITCGGVIPDNADYNVVLAPTGLLLGTVHEDFAIESMAGDVFQLGNASWRIQRVEPGTVRVEDAKGAPPSVPFWLGEAPGRSHALSEAVSRLRETLDAVLDENADDATARSAALAIVRVPGVPDDAGEQLVDYLIATKAALTVLPTQHALVAERFFDDAGGMQLVIHLPFGSRLNRAFGLALRKRFCRAFNFELQAAATEDAIVLSLGPTHSFPLEDIREYLHPSSVRTVLVQALLDAPMFETRFRWNATRALSVPRFSGGKKTPPPLLRMRSNDLLSLVFPDQQACLENIQGDREVPDHPLVRQTIDDCLHEAMDIDALEALLVRLDAGQVRFVCRDLTEPSPLAAEILGARPYAFLDDAPLEERRTQAVQSRRFMDKARAERLSVLDPAAIARVRAEAWPAPETHDELHDALCTLGCMTQREIEQASATALLGMLIGERRATRLRLPSGQVLVASAERLPELSAVHPDAVPEPPIEAPESPDDRTRARDQALLAIVQARIDAQGPVTASRIARDLDLSEDEIGDALVALEARGHVLRGRFTEDATSTGDEFCERGLLARIHRLTLDRLRSEIQPVSAQAFMRFLTSYQHARPAEQMRGAEGLRAVIEQLSGFPARASAWESDLLPQRVRDYEASWLDELTRSGQVRWARLSGPSQEGVRGGPVRSVPLSLCTSATFFALRALSASEAPALSSHAERVHGFLAEHGASFVDDIKAGTGLLDSVVEASLAELVSGGIATCDSFSGVRTLLLPAHKRGAGHPLRRKRGQASLAQAGRFALLKPVSMERDAAVEVFARLLLRRYGVVFRKLAEREPLVRWRELLSVYRRLEARGEVRGGRFVEGFSGEHFALPDAVPVLRRGRDEHDPGLLSLCGNDPLNLVGHVLPGARITALPSTRLVLQDGLCLGIREADQTQLVGTLPTEVATRVRTLLVRPDRGDQGGSPASARDLPIGRARQVD
jgi:ATP-dependent helicase Lhr and Lhr-like helicase